MTDTDAGAGSEDDGQRSRRWRINEDWAATVVGLMLLALVLAGVVPEGLVP
ncbi:hypothetical protein [Prauserella cavernicola]|uniref:Uncharacterized protein n=1 Tax=Prauserella cavernicola TaxID=2800127 RepID=A0A934QY99_9PSEU|nr:hypothetical protein [Prauserella cavernicola]MBK1787493.1 hypothetical protein [Prauserella cavernicola]